MSSDDLDERLDALREMSASIARGLLSHSDIAWEMYASFWSQEREQIRRIFAKTTVAIASAIVKEIYANQQHKWEET